MLLKLAVLLATTLVSSAYERPVDVLILGAGPSGLAAAKFLASKNVDFLIMEGSNELGGRVRSTDFGGIKVEEGTAGIYGTTANIQDIVDTYNIAGSFANYDSVIVRTSMNTQPDAEVSAAQAKLTTAQATTKVLYNQIHSTRLDDMSMRTALEHGHWLPTTDVEDVIEEFDYDFEYGKIPEEISTHGFEYLAAYQGNPYLSTDSRGLQDHLKRMAKEFMDIDGPHSKVKYGKVVDKITQTSSHVTVHTKGGITFTGKYVIVTFSMGVLKSGDVTFVPPLPLWKWDTIFRTSMESFTQVYVKFPTKFWSNAEWVLHANPRRGYYPIIFNMEAPGFHPAGTKMLMFTVMGEEARRVERSTDAEVLAEIKDVVKGMYGAATPEPTSVFVTRWLDDPFARGSFTTRQVGDGKLRFLRKLWTPIGRIYFAGEAYHEVMDGFVQGALQMGERTAKRLFLEKIILQ